jgi:hypothetical protein
VENQRKSGKEGMFFLLCTYIGYNQTMLRLGRNTVAASSSCLKLPHALQRNSAACWLDPLQGGHSPGRESLAHAPVQCAQPTQVDNDRSEIKGKKGGNHGYWQINLSDLEAEHSLIKCFTGSAQWLHWAYSNSTIKG